jgi:hypothetical protein
MSSSGLLNLRCLGLKSAIECTGERVIRDNLQTLIFGDLKFYPGDQIGRIFACWSIVNFGKLIENYSSRPNVWAKFSKGKRHALVLTMNGLGYTLDDFIKNTSGHPESYVGMYWRKIEKQAHTFQGTFTMHCFVMPADLLDPLA